MMSCDHIRWNSSEIILRLRSLGRGSTGKGRVQILAGSGVECGKSGFWQYKTGDISETAAAIHVVTINGLYKVVSGLSIDVKINDLE